MADRFFLIIEDAEGHDAMPRLRNLLKRILRSWGFRCLTIRSISMPDPDTCGSCVHYHPPNPLTAPEIGECRRHAPAPTPNLSTIEVNWPRTTAATMKCGEYEAEPEPVL